MKERKQSIRFVERASSRLSEIALADRRPEAMDERPFVNLAGGHKQLASFLDTEFLGSARGSGAVYPILLALRRLGCPIVMGRLPLPVEERPGAAWVTFRCSDKNILAMKDDLARTAGVALYDVRNDVRVIVVMESESIERVARQLDALAMQRSEWTRKSEA